ncbi:MULTISPECIES: type VI secretion system baseplate subunit TssF [unclassified Massilia]|uniref:type VI secretion system baseplate subunit TssF n=1 Tax=unclassified Massilia TaxID=2609279 RepID=UPI0017822ECD|nr:MULTISPECIES: type VI secretion system baseplate subunit TssF [unclassified Massilia]MBD8531771.1 type VI secretion system baseplate subunit TssF [Massilia sp. CFBP 13647]MBD8675216.1 type VI secretion system baseplate subunit TssF [Massilia sp. CFBP 13721]
MDQLLPYYESELGYLRRNLREFAERYPKIAGRLLISGEVCEDPHTERMIESFALLNARIAKRLDDDYPEFTEALFDVLYPHYLRPFPSCSIARLDVSGANGQSAAATLPRGTQLSTRPVRGGPCTFRTVYPVALAPLALAGAAFSDILRAPEAVRAPAGATAGISITLAAGVEQAGFKGIDLPALRVFIDGEPSFCAALRDALFMRTLAAYAEADGNGRWVALPGMPIRPAGFDEEDALIDFPARSHAAYRLLTEYFCFPEKFNFFDIDLGALGKALPGAKSVTLHLALGGIRSDSNTARLLATLSTNNLLLGCTPVINLFRQRGEPIRLTHTTASYPVLADARRAFAFEVQSIDSVNLVRQTPQGESVVQFRPFYSLQHAQTPEQNGHYWAMRRDETLAERSPGFETQIAIVDIDFDPAAVETDTLNLELTCSNRDLPALLSAGQAGGDLFMEGGSGARAIHFLRKPTRSWRFPSGRSAHWRLISHLSLNHLSISAGGVEAFREMLALYDLPRSPSSQRQIGGIHAIEQKATSAWLAGNPFNCLVRGVQVRLSIDEEAFIGSGIHAFTHIVERFLALYVHANSFTQLVIVSAKSGEELFTCLPKSGDLSLL